MTPHPTSASRRSFLSGMGNGLAGVALASLLQRESGLRAETSTWSPPDGVPHFAPKAKSVIWLFMAGGVSQTETFDPKPELTKHGGKTIPNDHSDSDYDDKLIDRLGTVHEAAESVPVTVSATVIVWLKLKPT